MGRLRLIKAALLMLCSVGLLSEALALPDCSSEITQLPTCLNFVEGKETSPPKSCCDGLKTVVADQPVCLCELLAGNISLPVPINMTLAAELPTLCNVDANTNQCAEGTASLDIPENENFPYSALINGSPTPSPLFPVTAAPSPGPTSDASRKIPGTILSIVQFAAAPVVASLLHRVY